MTRINYFKKLMNQKSKKILKTINKYLQELVF